MSDRPIYLLDHAATTEEKHGVFVLSLKSGGAEFRFAALPALAAMLVHSVMGELDAFHERKPSVVPFRRKGQAAPTKPRKGSKPRKGGEGGGDGP